MTYSHNSVRNNIRMTTAAATKSIRLKKGAASAAASPSVASSPSPTSVSASSPVTPLVTAHSNSIASSTNITPNNSNLLSSSPTNCTPILSGLSTPNNQQPRPRQSQSQSAGSQRRQQQQRQSPQQGAGGGGAFFFANNNRRTGGGRSPQGSIAVRQSPATILGGGFSPTMVATAGGSARKQRKSPPLGGKVSPQNMQQQHPLIPTALTHFAGSKCFDAPAPTALPKPPQHWTLSKSEEKQTRPLGAMMSLPKFQMPLMMPVRSSKRNLLDEFDTHNLKLLLNVQS